MISVKVNHYNDHILGTEKPQEIWKDETHQNQCLLCSQEEEEATVDGECYLAMVQNFFIPELCRLHLSDSTFFQQVCAPCHFVSNV